MYTRYFGLIDPPFSIAPNPRYLYMSDRHREALAHLLYGVESDGGFVLLTGEVGTGKTTVCRCLLEELPDEVDVAFILNPKLSALELLATICDDLHIEHPEDASLKQLVDRLNASLLDSHAAGRKTLLIIDEAQNLSAEVLEQLRLLTNLETNQRKLLQIILLGQPELLQMLASEELRQLSQRITARYHLDALTREEVAEYITHRLAVAGAKGTLFPGQLTQRIYRLSKGIPRLINLICDRALLGTYAQNRLQVDAPTIEQAAEEVFGRSKQRATAPLAAAALVLLGVTVAAAGWVLREAPVAEVTVAETGFATAAPDTVATTATANTPAETSRGDELDEPDLQPRDEPLTEAGPEPIAYTALLEAAPDATETRLPPQPETESLYGALLGAAHQSVEIAYVDLYRLWGLPFTPNAERTPCETALEYELRCWHRVGSLREIEHLDRPVILELTDATRRSLYITMAAFDEGVATLIVDGAEVRVDSDEFGEFWNGRYTLLWRSPPGYLSSSRRGDRGDTVAWLEQQLAALNGREARPLPDLSFDEQIAREVTRFQVSRGLVPDGIVGEQTLIHLNTASGNATPTLADTADL